MPDLSGRRGLPQSFGRIVPLWRARTAIETEIAREFERDFTVLGCVRGGENQVCSRFCMSSPLGFEHARIRTGLGKTFSQHR